MRDKLPSRMKACVIGPLGMKQRTPSRKLVRLAYPLMSSAIAEGSDENAWSC